MGWSPREMVLNGPQLGCILSPSNPNPINIFKNRKKTKFIKRKYVFPLREVETRELLLFYYNLVGKLKSNPEIANK
jgi:hypothetical protein